MGLPGRPSLARILLLPVAAVRPRRWRPAPPWPGLWTTGGRLRPVRLPSQSGAPCAAGAGAFVPGRVLVGFEAGRGGGPAGGRGRGRRAGRGRERAGPGWSSWTGAPTSARPPAGWPTGRGWRSPSRTGSAGSTPATRTSAGTSSPGPGANVVQAHDDGDQGRGPHRGRGRHRGGGRRSRRPGRRRRRRVRRPRRSQAGSPSAGAAGISGCVAGAGHAHQLPRHRGGQRDRRPRQRQRHHRRRPRGDRRVLPGRQRPAAASPSPTCDKRPAPDRRRRRRSTWST